ncbi:hypothetical protein [Nocardia pseudovaccinii]|uniref:hypothetical protein n=1 Tax=Nocardia pseudovaccinii TaxID=189540 RepID=UPI0012F50946|nr:hypothetical protein [Nocardia pseudovaccinii]
MIWHPAPRPTMLADARTSPGQATSTRPSGEPDVHLRINLRGVILDFIARASAAEQFIEDHKTHHYVDAVSVIPGDGRGLPRLPNEELYAGP